MSSRILSFAAASLLVQGVISANPCLSSTNPDTNSAEECKYLNPCTIENGKFNLSTPVGYTLECETMPCPANQDIMFDKIEGTDVGVLLEADCANTVDDCRAACESTVGCCGFNFVWNPGQYDSQEEGRCVAKACDGRIGTSRYGMVFYQRDAGAVPADPPSSPPPSSPAANPCFPSNATVTTADGTSVRINALKEGDEIVAATGDGSLTTDTLSILSIAMPDAKAAVYITIVTAANKSLTLTPTHHVPVGAECCSTLKQAKDVEVGDKVWAVKDGKAAATTVTAKSVTKATGLHSPVLTNGGFPVVDGIVTAFDSIDKVTLAKHGLAPLLKACKATGTCETFRDMFFSAEDREYVATK